MSEAAVARLIALEDARHFRINGIVADNLAICVPRDVTLPVDACHWRGVRLGLPSVAPLRAPAGDPPQAELPLLPSTDAHDSFASA